MKFSKLIAVLAISSVAVSANANDGTLRRTYQVAQADSSVSQTNNKEVIVINTSPQQTTSTQQTQAVSQPVTTVEASPAVESKAEALRRARQGAEVQTEQRIVEKLEDSRLQEERARADRLFGNKLDPQPQAPPPVQAAPVVVAPVQQQQEKNTQVNIEKIEINEPQREEKHLPPVVESKVEVEKAEEAPKSQRYYVFGQAGNSSYAASNVKSNYGLGIGGGVLIDNRIAVELSYFYSNHDIADAWTAQLFHSLDQSDLSAAGKLYLLPGSFKPYIGGELTWINRRYTERFVNANYTINSTGSETTNAVNLGLLGGVDFAVNDNFMIGAGVDYNFNVMTTNDIELANYGLPAGTQALEKISFWTIKVSGKFLF